MPSVAASFDNANARSFRREAFFPLHTTSAPHDASPPTENQLTYPGWRVAAVGHIGVLTGFATVFIYSFSFLVKPLQHEFGWSREQVSSAFSIAAISVAICSPFMGRLFDRFEPRKIIAAMLAAFGLGIGSLAFLTAHLAQLYVCAAFIGISGTGTYQLGFARVVTAWFERRLGAALSIVVAGSGIGSLLIPPLVEYLLSAHGWRVTYLALAALPLFVGAPLTWFFAPSPPSSRPSEPHAAPTSGMRWTQALGTRSFWILALGVCALSVSENGALAHLAPMLGEHGLQATQVAIVASLLGVSSVVGRFILGSLLDYVHGGAIAVASLLAAGSGMLVLAHAHSFLAAAPAAFIAGLGAGCELDLIPYMLRRYFGLRSFTTLYGLVYSCFAVAGAAAPLIVGRIYDKTGSYNWILNLFCAITLVGAFAMLALPAYRYIALPAASTEPGLEIDLALEPKGAVLENN
jgi:MFS family permease